MTQSALDAVFAALSDPTRPELVARLTREGPRSATALARGLPMTRQAVVHHLQALGTPAWSTPGATAERSATRRRPSP